MDRLVVKSKAGSLYYNYTEKGVKLEPHEITPHQRRLLLERLHVYEDTGLTPPEIVKLKDRDTAKAPEEYDGHWSGDVSGTKAKCIAWKPLPEPYRSERRKSE